MCVPLALATLVPAVRAAAAEPEPVSLPATPRAEAEPNGSTADATPINSGERILGTLPTGDTDVYSFSVRAGDRIFANTVTAGSSEGSDTTLELLDSEGAEVESDDDDGTQLEDASSIAGAVAVAEGTYYLVVTNGGSRPITSYDLYLQVRTGPATPETDLPVEPPIGSNGTQAGADPLGNGEVVGEHASRDQDWFSIELQAGDTVFLSLGITPPADTSKALLGFGPVGDLGKKQPLMLASVPSDAAHPSEALTMTVSAAGTYYIWVGSSDNTASDPAWSYDLSATVIAGQQQNCRTYSAAEGPIADGSTASFPIQVDDSIQIERAALNLDLEDLSMTDLDISLRNPNGVELPVYYDFGSSFSEELAKRQTQMQALFDDFAAVPPQYNALRPLDLQPEGGPRLGLLGGQSTHGLWEVLVRDDTLNGSTGILHEARLVFCGPESLLPLAGSGGNSGAQRAQSSSPQPSAPVLSGLAIGPDSFRAARAGPMLMTKRPRKGGTLVSYQVSQATETNFVLSEANPGRKVGRRCVPENAANASDKPCTRWVKVISFIRNDAAGRNQFGFTGRVGARKLPAGEFRLRAQAFAPSGLTSSPVSVNFTILAPVPKAK